MLLKIVVQNSDSETVINNVGEDELHFWFSVLEGSVNGDIKVYDSETGLEYPSSQQVA